MPQTLPNIDKLTKVNCKDECVESANFHVVFTKLNWKKLQIGHTVKNLNVQTPKNFAVITLKCEQDGFTEE